MSDSKSEKATKTATAAEVLNSILKKLSLHFAEKQGINARHVDPENKKPLQTLHILVTDPKKDCKKYMDYATQIGAYLSGVLDKFIAEISAATIPVDINSKTMSDLFISLQTGRYIAWVPCQFGAWAELDSSYKQLLLTDLAVVVKTQSNKKPNVFVNEPLLGHITGTFMEFLRRIAFNCATMCGESSKVSEQHFINALFMHTGAYSYADGKEVSLITDFIKQLDDKKKDEALFTLIKNNTEAKQSILQMMQEKKNNPTSSQSSSSTNGVSTNNGPANLIAAINAASQQ